MGLGGGRQDYATAAFLLGLVVTLVGQTVCWWLVQRLGRRSIIVFAMAGLLLMALTIITYSAGLSTLRAVRAHTLLQFSSICATE